MAALACGHALKYAKQLIAVEALVRRWIFIAPLVIRVEMVGKIGRYFCDKLSLHQLAKPSCGFQAIRPLGHNTIGGEQMSAQDIVLSPKEHA